MSATERLYYDDSRLLEFDAHVVDLSQRDDGTIGVVLDRTAFYPTGGGQPHDTGMLGDAQVIDCIDAEANGLLHVIQGPAPEIGDLVHGRVDRLRRLDHLQQHTGQHILSAVFVKLFDAPTQSFRVLEHECEIDVELDNPSDEKIETAVDLANQIIWEARPIDIKNVSSAEAAALPLRKEPAREGDLRIIEIDDFDLTPCGGTHARSTAEVGCVAVSRWERAKGLTRIHFMAGVRALNDYRKANRTATEVAGQFSSGRDDSPALVAKLIEENKHLVRRVRELDEIACRVEADDLLRDKTEPLKVINKLFDNRSADSLKHLAQALMSHPGVVAILASREGDTARLVFARSADAAGDMNALMRQACQMIDGRGGGKPELAQGGGKNAAALEEALATVVRSVLTPDPAFRIA